MEAAAEAMTGLLPGPGPAAWALGSIAIWITYVVLRGWHTLSVWDRRQVAFGVFTALLMLNFLSMDEQFQGWADVFYFCGRQLQYCTCNFRWNARGWAKAYILWSFVLSSASGLQRVVIQLGLNGLLPGEEVVTRESIVSICWRLIPYWLNNWEQQWGAECSSMMFELPHFAVELLVILPCIQILCARLKILAMPLVHMGGGAPGVPLLEGGIAAPAVAADNVVAAPAVGRAGRNRRANPWRGVWVVARDDYAPNILKGYWERRPEQRRLLPRLRANLQVMLFAACVTALAASNALLVPLLLESSVTAHPATQAIKLAGRHTEWFAANGLNQSAFEPSALTAQQVSLLNARLMAFQAPRQPLLSGGGLQLPSFLNSSSAQAGLAAEMIREGRITQLTRAFGRHLQQVPLRAAIAERSMVGLVHALLGTELWEAAFGWSGPAGQHARGAVASAARRAARNAAAAAAEAAAAANQNVADAAVATSQGVTEAAAGSGEGAGVGRGREEDAAARRTCSDQLPRFKANLAKHAEEIHKMQAAEHRALIPLVESALAVMRLSCEKYFVLLSVFVAHLLFREHPPRHVRAVIRFNARLSTAFQKVILYSFPAVCWVYGAGLLFSLFVSAVFWGTPIMATYEGIKKAISAVRIRSLRHANAVELERMGGNCTICWGDMHIGDCPPEPQRTDTSTAAGSATDGNAAPAAAVVEASAAAAVEQGQAEVPLPAEPAAEPAAAAGEQLAGGVAGEVQLAGAGGVAAGQQPEAAGALPDSAALDEQDQARAQRRNNRRREQSRAWSLPCGHAYHHACLTQWLTQCHSTGLSPTCPMCQAVIRMEVRWRFPFPWKWPVDAQGRPLGEAERQAAFNQGLNQGLAVGQRLRRGMARVHNDDHGDHGGDGSDDSDDEEDDEGAEAVMMPVVNGGAGLGRQRAAGRVRAAGPPRAHENLLLPPPMAALGGMNMLRLLDHQRELQELLQDMPQIPPPDDVQALQLVAAGHEQGGGAVVGDVMLPDLPAAAARPQPPAAPVPQQLQPRDEQQPAAAAAGNGGELLLAAIRGMDAEPAAPQQPTERQAAAAAAEARLLLHQQQLQHQGVGTSAVTGQAASSSTTAILQQLAVPRQVTASASSASASPAPSSPLAAPASLRSGSQLGTSLSGILIPGSPTANGAPTRSEASSSRLQALSQGSRSGSGSSKQLAGTREAATSIIQAALRAAASGDSGTGGVGQEGLADAAWGLQGPGPFPAAEPWSGLKPKPSEADIDSFLAGIDATIASARGALLPGALGSLPPPVPGTGSKRGATPPPARAGQGLVMAAGSKPAPSPANQGVLGSSGAGLPGPPPPMPRGQAAAVEPSPVPHTTGDIGPGVQRPELQAGSLPTPNAAAIESGRASGTVPSGTPALAGSPSHSANGASHRHTNGVTMQAPASVAAPPSGLLADGFMMTSSGGGVCEATVEGRLPAQLHLTSLPATAPLAGAAAAMQMESLLANGSGIAAGGAQGVIGVGAAPVTGNPATPANGAQQAAPEAPRQRRRLLFFRSKS